MFWERSDSLLSNDQIRGLKDTELSSKSALDYIWPFLEKSGWAYAEISREINGTFNRVFQIRDLSIESKYGVRFNLHPHPNLQSIHLEQWINNEAIARGFPTPQIIHVDTSRTNSKYPFQIVEWSNSISLRAANEELTRKALSQLGYKLRDLHKVQIGEKYGRVNIGLSYNWDDFWTSEFESHVDYLTNNKILNEEEAYNLLFISKDFIDQNFYTGEPCLLHGDLSYDNVLINDSGFTTVIDWEDAVLGDPIFELAGLATFHPIERHKYFIDSYYEGIEKPLDFEHRFWLYYLRIALAKAVHRHRFDYKTEVKPGWQSPNDRINLAFEKLKKL